MTYSYLSQRASDGTHSISRRVQLLTAIAALFAFAALTVVTVPNAAAAISDSEELIQVGSTGEGAGQLKLPASVASDPTTGHFYVVEEHPNNRIDEFTPWGKFVKAFGWDVAPGAVNEQQEVRVRASTGQFKLAFGASITPDLAFDAPGSESEGPGSVEAALNALPSIGGAGGEVSVEAVPGTPDGKTPFISVVAFKGSLAGTNVAQLTITNGTTPLSGGVPSTSLEARTSADGTAGGTGLESCTAESGCKAGLQGVGTGQLDGARGVAMDAAANLYVREVTNHRVQKFDSAGRFLLMFGGEANKTKVEAAAPQAEQNVCPIDPSDVCQASTTGTGNGQFGPVLSQGIALCTGSLFVADKDRIQRFSLAGAFEASLPVAGEIVQILACDSLSGGLYATFEPKPDVHKLDSATGEEISEIEVEGPGAIATDSAGSLFVNAGSSLESKVLEFDSTGKPLSPPSCCEAPPFLGVSIGALGTNAAGDLIVAYRSLISDNFIRVFGPAPVSFESAPPVPPEITTQFASSVQRDDATVAADINPHFFTDADYYVQYGIGKCSEGGCPEVAPVTPAPLTSKVTASEVRTAGVFLDGLAPGTTYHYRFIAQSNGGGPVYGIDPDGDGPDEASSEGGGEATFTTFPEPLPVGSCANDAFRIGPAARLPNCRAYEMVSPVDKNNGDIKTLLDFVNYNTSLSRSAEDGGRFTYSSYRSFGEPKGGPYANQYLASRDPRSGWSSVALDVAQESHFNESAFENPYKAFSSDLCSGWLIVGAEPALAPGALAGKPEIYRHDECGGEGYEALTKFQPLPGTTYSPVLQGTSADGKEAVLVAEDKLTDDAASGAWQTYYASGGQLRLLCVGVDGQPSGGNCLAGTGPPAQIASTPVRERLSSLTHALSADGSKAYWTNSAGKISGPGKVYLRLNPGEGQSALSGEECVEAEKACTVKVSETVTPKAARLLLASSDGAKALFEVTEGAQVGKLYKFDLEAGGSQEVAGKAIGVAAASEDLARVYFVSEEAIAGTTGAAAGKPNLYLDEDGEATFIATISKKDAIGGEIGGLPSNVPPEALFHAARASDDGRVLAFISTESLTGYDNTDLVGGEADSEVYVYEVGAEGPVCVSCNPSGARPVGRSIRGPGNSAQSLPTSGSLATPESSLYSPRALSRDGQRLFFNSFNPLLPRDTNGKGDVYEWEAASGVNECEEKGAELYVASSGGCLSLISSGQSPSDSEFLDASASGSDVFFTTAASLLRQDPGLVDVYDAREGGGLPAPPEPPGPCQGEACQFAPPPPNDPTPASASFKGAGNLKPRGRCAKGKVARKGRCVAKKRKQVKKRHRTRHANENRRTNR